ncbi:hypothetical protein COLO4_35530 [Corchorus olitorius]|uniref:Uncharacterized protein n=1 Tax=Corchorus olitorius TaxID=93759 RepID=A0A1R3GFQ7_9ROSI|nr:hypothetical protein COLO4_35530 [Corchorus olitorius]
MGYLKTSSFEAASAFKQQIFFSSEPPSSSFSYDLPLCFNLEHKPRDFTSFLDPISLSRS